MQWAQPKSHHLRQVISQDALSWELLLVHSPSKILESYLGLAQGGLSQHYGAFPLSSHLIDKTEELPKNPLFTVTETPSVTSTPGVHQKASAISLAQAGLQSTGNEQK